MSGVSRDQPQVVDGTYAVERRLGSGGMGSVFQVRHLNLGKVFALKLIHPKMLSSQDGLKRFEVEARALGRLDHPAIVRVTDYGFDRTGDGAPFLVMEHLVGETLKERLEREGAMAPELALPLLEAVAEGLDFAHRQGILHRDLKPGNVILAESAAGAPQARIVDFGLARFLGEQAEPAGTRTGGWRAAAAAPALRDPVRGDDDNTLALAPEEDGGSLEPPAAPATAPSPPTGLTQAGIVVGTAGYMAPEVADREATSPASDIYSFGVLAYEVLAGARPFSGSVMALLRAHVFDAPPPPSKVNPALPPELDAPLLAPLAKDPRRRPQTAGAVVRALVAGWARARERRFRARELPRRAFVALLIAVGAALLMGAVGGWGPVEDLEGRLVDLRFRLAAPRLPSPRLALALLDDATLEADPSDRLIADYHDEVAEVLGKALEAGAVGVGLDVVTDLPSWREALTPLLLEHHERVVLALHWDGERERYKGQELVEGSVTVVLGENAAAAMLGLVNLDQDRDGTVRRSRPGWRDAGAGVRPAFAARVATIASGSPLTTEAAEGPFWVDYRVDWRSLPHWSWHQLAEVIATRPEAVRGRFLLVGGDIEGYGDTGYPLPHRDGRLGAVPGVVVQSLIACTLLDGCPVRGPVLWVPASSCVLLFPLALAVLWWRSPAAALALCGAALLLHAVVALVLFIGAARVVPVAAVVVVYPLAIAVALALRWLLPSRADGRTS